MEDIIALESALSDVQYQIEGLSGTLRNYDRLITFSTIDVYLSEVRDLTIVQEEDTFLSDLKTAAVTGTRGLIHVVQSLILTVVSGWWIFLGIGALQNGDDCFSRIKERYLFLQSLDTAFCAGINK